MSDDADSDGDPPEDAEGGDPFDHLADGIDQRRGDPFDHLDDAVDDSGGRGRRSDIRDIEPHPDKDEFEWWIRPGSGANRKRSSRNRHLSEENQQTPESMEADSPFAGPDAITDDVEPLTDAVDPDEDHFESMGGTFEEMEVGGVDPNRIWKDLSDAESGGSVDGTPARTYADVSKHAYCEQCEFFSEPPDVSCTHDGTEIVEFLDINTVRVVDCPIVANREELEEDDSVAMQEEDKI